ncbi:transposase [Arcicella aurantiaca]|nr:transposase [Arcicella aurantiaca]
MMKLEFKPFYERNLPHFQKNDVYYFITMRLSGSLPLEVILQLQKEQRERLNEISELSDKSYVEKRQLVDEQHRRYFGKFDKLLDNPKSGPTWLILPAIAKLVKHSIHFYDDKKYELLCYTIMSNHVHLVFRILQEDYPLHQILKFLKGYSGKKANEILRRNGEFWQHESYDRIVRDGKECERIITYILNNPVKIGLVEKWQDYEYSYVNEKYYL